MKKKLQVFVSSTYTDLKDERQAAVSAILKAGHIPAGMELFTAGDRSQMTTIEKWIDESDVYMLILGGRYGSVEKTTSLSYTELEYDYARQQGKAMFSVVIEDEALTAKVKQVGPDALERENPKELALFREKVLSNICSFFSDEKDVRLCVHESLADLAEREDLRGWISADALEDVKDLHDEIKRLRQENEQLKTTVKHAEQQKPSLTAGLTTPSFKELCDLLNAIQIKIPEDITDTDNGFTLSLLQIFVQQKDVLVRGVTNWIDAGKVESFLYHNVCPKLQIYGLTDNEKVPGVRYRRSFVTKQGTAFLSSYEKEQILNAKKNT